MEGNALMVQDKIPVRAYDVDAMGYVSNIVYVRWFEDLRHLFLDSFYPYSRMLMEGITPVMLHTELDYRHHLTIHDLPDGRCWLKSLSYTKWTMGFEIFQNEVIHCSGEQRGYFMNLESHRPSPIPEHLRKAYEQDVAGTLIL